MNRVHKTLWSESAQCWQAVPETAKAAGKRSVKSASGGVLATVVMGLALSGGAGAQSPPPPASTQLPMGGSVVRGSATISQTATAQAAAMTVNQSSQRAIINWDSFNLGQAASINFVQPNAQAVTLNRVNDNNPSQIFGRITSNGQVFLSNPSGVYFSPTASVDVGALVATSHSISDAHFMAGNYQFERNGATGKVVNEGRISAGLGGYVALLAPEVQNAGVVLARAGTVALAAGEVISLQVQGGGLAGITTTPSAIQTLIENKLAVQAPDGQIILSAVALNKLQAGVIKNSGSLEANSLVAKGGKIYLEADDITLAATSRIEAKGPTGGGTVLVGGDWQGSGDLRQATKVTMEAGARIDASATDQGDGGKVVLWSDIHQNGGMTRVNGSIQAAAGPNGGDGGKIETSGHFLNVDGIQVSTQSAKGPAGEWLLDPYNITITNDATATSGTAYNPTAPSPSFTSGATSSIRASSIQNALALNSVTITTGGSVGDGQGNGDIQVASNITWSSANSLTLSALGEIYGTGNFVRTGTAGLTFTQTGNSTGSGYAGVISGTGSFVKSGAGSLKLSGLNTFTGNISIGSGTLQIGDAGSLNSGNYTGTISNSGTFKYSSSADQTLSGIISSTGALVKDTDANSTLTLNGANTYTGTTTISAGNLQIGNGSTTGSLVATAITNNANLVLNRSDTSSTISGIISGTGNLIKQGAGTVSLTAANTYTGTTTISAGSLRVGNASTTGTLGTGAITVADGATLAFNRTGTLTVANDISGAGGVQQIANGTTVLTGNNSYSGTTTITSGTLQVGSGATAGTLGAGLVVNSSTLTFNRSDNVTLDKSISGSGTVNVLGSRVVSLGSTSALGNGIANIGADVNSTLTLDLNGYSLTNTQLKLNGAGYNGQGVLVNNSATAVALPSTVAVNLVTNSSIGGSGDLSIAGVISGTKLTKLGINTLYLSGTNTYSSGTVINNGILKKGNKSATGGLTSNPLTINGGTLDINGFEVTQADNSYNHTETFTGSGYNNLGVLINSKNDGATPVYWVVLDIGGTGFSLGGAGNLYLKTYSVTNATGKTIGKLGSGSASLEFSSGANYSVAYAISAGMLDLRSGGGMSGYNVISGTSADIAAGASFKITGYSDITRFNVYNTTFGGSITGAGSLIVDGLSQVKLTGANIFSGGTTIVGGTLVAGVASTSIGGAITSSPLGTGAVTVASGGSFDFAGYAVNNNIAASGTGSNSTGAIQNSSGSVTTSANITLNGGATFNVAGTGLSLSGTVTDGSSAGAITKAGTGALTLGGANTYSGGTTVSAGNVVAGSASTSSGGALTSGALGTGALNIASGASFDFAGNNVDNNITATGTGISFAGAIRNTTGTVTSNANITLVGGATINVAGTNLTLNGVLADGSTAGAITKTGTGDLVLKGANTYTGSTTISAGVLEVGGTGSLGGGTYAGAISIASTSGGAFKYTSSANETLSGVISGAGAVIKDGSASSTLTLSGNNTFTGATNINSGTLRVASSNALGSPTSGATTVASGATIEIGGASNLAIGAEAITLAAGASIHNVMGANTYSGALTLQGNANIDVDTTTSLNLSRVGSATVIPAGATLSTTLGGNLTVASGVTGGSMDKVTIGGSYTGSTGTTVVTSVTGLFVRLCDTVSVGTAACTTSSTYGASPNYTYGFFSSSTGGSRVAMNAADYSVSNLTWTGTLPTSTSSAGTYALTYASGISSFTNAAYRLMGAGAATNWTITPKAVSISLTSPSYTYDGATTYAAIANAASLSAPGMVGADSVTSVTKTISGAGVAQAGNFTITPSLPVLGAGTVAGNYSFTLVPLTGSVAKANLSLSGTKVYDGTSAVLGAQLTATGVNGESFAVSGTGASGNLATANVQSNATLSSLSGLTLGSSNGGSVAVSSNYNSLSTTGSSFSVTPATAKLTAAKTYDGDDTLSVGQLSITGVTVNGVTQTLGFTGTASVADANVAYANNHVTGVGLTLGNGTGLASNYQLPALAYGSNNSATISPATASVSASKTYDGSTSLSSAQVSLTGVVVNGTSQTLAYTGTAALSDANVATANKYVNTSQMVLTNGTGGNAGTASNYVLPAAAYHVVRNTASVSALALTATDIGAATSVYGDAITGGALTFNNKVGTDDVTSAVTVTVPVGSYSTTGHANAGSYFQSASNVLTGTKASNYSFAGLTSLTANYTVSAKPLTISVPGATKVYDASNTISPTAPASIIGVVAGDDVQLGAGNVTGFVDKNVGVNKAVTYIGFSINGGNDAGNYALSANPASTADITPKPITATGITALSKVYNASPSASLNTANAAISSGATTRTDNKTYSADVVTLDASNATGSFANANVGTAKAVTITGLALSGADAGNYAVTDASAATANITPKSVTVNGLSVPVSRAYNGTTSATVTGVPALSNAQAAGAGTANDGIPYVGDAIQLLGTATGSYDSKDVLTASNVQFGGLTSGNANYTLVLGSQAATITPKSLTVTGTVVASKVYDGNTTATWSNSSLVGVEAGDVAHVVLDQVGGFADKNAGTAKPVNLVSSISGAQASNYSLVQQAGLSADIHKAPLTVTANNASKTYGDANPTLSTTVSGFVNGETLATSGVAGTGAATTTATTATGAGTATITSGVGSLTAANYDFSNLVNGTLTINKAPLTVTANNASKTYGDANPTLSTTVSGFVNGETLATSGVAGSGNATTTATTATGAGTATITAGVGSLTANNYDFSNLVNGTLTIHKAPLTVTANNASKTYGDANPTLSTTVSGFVNGETLGTSGVAGTGAATTTATTATGAGTATITAGVGSLTASNYDFSNLVNGTLTISKANFTQVTASKTYDGLATVTFGQMGTIAGVNGETFTATMGTASISDKNVVTAGKTLTNLSGLTLTSSNGGLASNYNLSSGLPSAGSNNTVTITAANLPVSGLTASNKVFDGTPTATLGGAAAISPIAGDTVTLSGTAAGSFVDANAGTAKAITITGLGLSGSDASNYTLVQQTGLTADITAAAVDSASINPGQVLASVAPPQVSPPVVTPAMPAPVLNVPEPSGPPPVISVAPPPVVVATPAPLPPSVDAVPPPPVVVAPTPLPPVAEVVPAPTVPVAPPAPVVVATPTPLPPSVDALPPPPVVVAAPTPLPPVTEVVPAPTVPVTLPAPVVVATPAPLPPSVDTVPAQPGTVVAAVPPGNADSDTNNKDKPTANVSPRPTATPALQGEQVAYLRPAEASVPALPALPAVPTVRAEPSTPPASTTLAVPALPQAPALASTAAPAPASANAITGPPATASAQVATASPEAPRPAPTVASVNAPAAAPAGTGVLAITILRSNNAQPSTAGVAFEQNADTVSLRATDAPPLPPSSERLVFNDRLTTFMVANNNGVMVEFQGSLVNNRMVIVAPSNAAKLVAQTDMNTVLAAAVVSLGRESRVMLAQLEGVVLDLR